MDGSSVGATVSSDGRMVAFVSVQGPVGRVFVRDNLRGDVDGFLADHGLTRADLGWYVAHPGGPKVLEAMQDALEVDRHALGMTWDSLARIGNLSSASVLHVLADTLRERPPAPGSYGLLLAMGPGFCLEMVLLRAAGD